MEKEERTIQYHTGKMTEEEAKVYLQDIETDAELEQIDLFHRQISDDLQAQIALQKLKAFHDKKVNEGLFKQDQETELKVTYTKQNKLYTYLSIAASVVVLLVTTWFILPILNKDDAQMLADTIKSIPKDQLELTIRKNDAGMTGIGEIENILLEAYAKFKEESYEEAVPLLEEYLEVHPDDYQARFIFALCLIKTNKYPLATSQLEIIEKQPLFSARNEVLLKLAALYLQQETQKEKACGLLQHVTKEGTMEQQQQSQQLLNYCNK